MQAAERYVSQGYAISVEEGESRAAEMMRAAFRAACHIVRDGDNNAFLDHEMGRPVREQEKYHLQSAGFDAHSGDLALAIPPWGFEHFASREDRLLGPNAQQLIARWRKE